MSLEIKKKKKNVPRNRKIYWRKHVDIRDVDAFLDEKRREERIGVDTIKHKKDEELFVIDPNANEISSKLSKKQRALLPPRCLENLRPLTAVPDPIVKRNRVRTKEERKSSIRKAIEEKKRRSGFVPRKELEAKKSRAITLAKKKTIPKTPTFTKNLWEENDQANKKIDAKWLNEETLRHQLITAGSFQIKVPKGIRKRKSVLPIIEPPHPGTSYNPSLKDHQELLNMVVERELEKQKKEAHLKRVTTDLFGKVTPSEKADEWMNEMSQGLPQIEMKQENGIKEESDEEIGEYKALNPPTSFMKRKTRKQKRIKKQEREALLQRKAAKVEKKKVADIYKLKFIHDKLEKTKIVQQKKAENRKKLAEFHVARTKRLSTKSFEDQDITFSRKHELSGNLRNIKMQGNVLADRFYSLQKRNILVPSTKRISLKKAKRKAFTKASHKLEDIVGYRNCGVVVQSSALQKKKNK